jgi:hypothetical protein
VWMKALPKEPVPPVTRIDWLLNMGYEQGIPGQGCDRRRHRRHPVASSSGMDYEASGMGRGC